MVNTLFLLKTIERNKKIFIIYKNINIFLLKNKKLWIKKLKC